MMSNIVLRDLGKQDLAALFEHQLDPAANHMAAFGAKDPSDRRAFSEKWAKILGDDTITKQAILCDGEVVGSVVAFVAPWSQQLEVSYWLGRQFWGRGIATKALAELLRIVTVRPIYARAAKDNIASIRVLEKCGFAITGFDKCFAPSRGEEVEEVILELRATTSTSVTLDQCADLTPADREQIRQLSLAVYPADQIAEWSGRQLEWSMPEYCVRIRSELGMLISFAGVYVREGKRDGQLVRIGGIGNLKTHPTARRRGLAGVALRHAVEFFREQGCIGFLLLVCEPHLVAYYARLGWREFRGQLLIRQQGRECEFTLNRIMTYGVEVEADQRHDRPWRAAVVIAPKGKRIAGSHLFFIDGRKRQRPGLPQDSRSDRSF